MNDLSAAPILRVQGWTGTTHMVGCDDGYAAIKLAWINESNGGSRILTHMIPSRAQSGVSRVGDLKGKTANSYETDDGTYSVHAALEGLNTQFTDYPVSGLNRALVHHALHTAGFAGMRVKLMTGLPPGAFYNSGTVNQKLVNAKRQSLLKPVKTLVGEQLGPRVEVVEHRVMPEAICAVIDWTLDAKGNEINSLNGAVAVVDIGGRTTDIVVILPDDNGLAIDHGRSGTHVMGVLHLHNELSETIRNLHGLENEEMASFNMDTILRTKRMRVSGREQDVSAAVNQAVNAVGGRILQLVQQHVGRGVNLDTILFVGGGAEIMGAVVGRYQNAWLVEQPQFANARGFLKAGLYL